MIVTRGDSLRDASAPVSATEDELALAKRTASEVLMSSRHYLAVDEPESNFAGGKL